MKQATAAQGCMDIDEMHDRKAQHPAHLPLPEDLDGGRSSNLCVTACYLRPAARCSNITGDGVTYLRTNCYFVPHRDDIP